MTDDVVLPDGNPKTRMGAAKPGVFLVPPLAILEMGRVFVLGAKKYGPYNWRGEKVSYSTYYNAAHRHLAMSLDGENLDPESGVSHLAHVMCCMAIIVDASACGMLIDDRPMEGATSEYLVAHTKALT
jgi:hypothetical protein